MADRYNGVSMELVIGGCFQGKLAYVKEKLAEQGHILQEAEILEGGEMGAWNRETPPRVLNALHLLIRKYVMDGTPEEISPLLEGLLAEHPDLIVICDEVGCGIVPIDERERIYREIVGRTLCGLAGRAKGMERITGGLPVKIK